MLARAIVSDRVQLKAVCGNALAAGVTKDEDMKKAYLQDGMEAM
jgi:hypothetical protein